MPDIWGALTDAQASVLSTLILVVAGGLGVLFSALMFGARVRNLETALSATEARIDATLSRSSEKVDGFNKQLDEKLGAVDEQFSATLDVLGQLRTSIASMQDTVDESASSQREQLKKHWYAIADKVEEIASSPNIHGKIRARYSKIPRHTLHPLLKTLIDEGRLSESQKADLNDALELWTWHRNGKPTLSQADVDRMREYAGRLIPGYRA